MFKSRILFPILAILIVPCVKQSSGYLTYPSTRMNSTNSVTEEIVVKTTNSSPIEGKSQVMTFSAVKLKTPPPKRKFTTTLKPIVTTSIKSPIPMKSTNINNTTQNLESKNIIIGEPSLAHHSYRYPFPELPHLPESVDQIIYGESGYNHDIDNNANDYDDNDDNDHESDDDFSQIDDDEDDDGEDDDGDHFDEIEDYVGDNDSDDDSNDDDDDDESEESNDEEGIGIIDTGLDTLNTLGLYERPPKKNKNKKGQSQVKPIPIHKPSLHIRPTSFSTKKKKKKPPKLYLTTIQPTYEALVNKKKKPNTHKNIINIYPSAVTTPSPSPSASPSSITVGSNKLSTLAGNKNTNKPSPTQAISHYTKDPLITQETQLRPVHADVSGSDFTDLDVLSDIYDKGFTDGKLKHGKMKRKQGHKLKKILFPLLIAYKLKFFTLVPIMIGGMLLLLKTTGAAGFFFALFTVVLCLKGGGSSHHH